MELLGVSQGNVTGGGAEASNWASMRDAVEAGDEHLLARVAVGDEDAFRTLYRRHQGRLYRYALHMTGRVETAEEAVQEAFMVLLQEGEKFDPSRGAVAAFLLGVARNHVYRLLEADGRYVGTSEEGLDSLAAQVNVAWCCEQTDMADDLARTEITARVRHAIVSLPERYREVVTLCDLEEMAYEEAAAILHCPVGTVRSRLNRARTMLAGKLRTALTPRPRTEFSPRRAVDAR